MKNKKDELRVAITGIQIALAAISITLIIAGIELMMNIFEYSRIVLDLIKSFLIAMYLVFGAYLAYLAWKIRP